MRLSRVCSSLFALALLVLTGTVHSAPPISPMDLSASRAPDAHWEDLAGSFFDRLAPMRPLDQEWPVSPGQVADHYSQLNKEYVPEWKNTELIREAFEFIRDFRFLSQGSRDQSDEQGAAPTANRRISWLYPDDGCFARAALVKDRVTKVLRLPSARVFIFGNLNVKTDNSRYGSVSWWYHTAFVVRSGTQVFVFDPAINPMAPMELSEWVLKQVPDLDSARLAFCAADAFHPGSSCYSPEDSSEMGYQAIPSYLRAEWYRQTELGRDPAQVLGDNPPWKNRASVDPLRFLQ